MAPAVRRSLKFVTQLFCGPLMPEIAAKVVVNAAGTRVHFPV